jgi:hypothetical protein
MKSFKDYITEGKKTYAFKIKVAGDITEEFKDNLKTAMERFSVVKMSNGKRTPITENPLDFPMIKNTSVTVFEVEVSYPTTSQVLEAYVSQVCRHPASQVVVRAANEEASLQDVPDIKAKKDLEDALLATEDMGGESAQDQVGSTKVSSFLKDLAAVAKDREVKNQPKEKAAEMPESGASISPIGSKAQKGK